jgi:hypothetical protein
MSAEKMGHKIWEYISKPNPREKWRESKELGVESGVGI